MLTAGYATIRAELPYVLSGVHVKDNPNLTADEMKDMRKKLYEECMPLGIRYTKTHPIIVAADWTFKPYTFVNDHGHPDGFQIDVFRNVFTKLHLPYELRLMNWSKACNDVADGRAQVSICIPSADAADNLFYGRETVSEYQLAIIHLKTSEHIRSLMLFGKNDTVYCKKDDYADIYLRTVFADSIPFTLINISPKKAFADLLSGKIRYYIWGRAALQSIVNKYEMNDIFDVDHVDIPPGQFRFAGSDPLLLFELDKQLRHLKASGEYEKLVNKWLVDNPVDEDKSGFIEALIVFLLILVILGIIFVAVIVQRNSGKASLKHEFQTLFNGAIDLTNCQMLMISVRKNWVYNVSGDFIPEEGISYEDFVSLVHPDDEMIQRNTKISVDKGTTEMPIVRFRMKKFGDSTDNWRLLTVHAYIKANAWGKPIYVYLVLIDETDRINEQRKLDQTISEVSAITEISDIGMIYYDMKGRFVNCNRSVVRLFDKGGTNRADGFLRHTKIQEILMLFCGINVEENMHMWFCSVFDIPELNLYNAFEVRIENVYGENGANRGYAIAIADLEENIRLKRDWSQIEERLTQLKAELTRYQTEMRFIMRRNKLSTFRWRKGNDYVEVSRDIIGFDKNVSLKKFYNSIIADDKESYRDMVDNTEEYLSKPIHVTRKYNLDVTRPEDTKWCDIIVVPEYDEDNNFIGAFGLTCDITNLMHTQQKLRKETAKAKDSGRQKALFLANMTHELRTPLNAVNGFAEIMMLFSTPEEKKEYINIMARNCSMLIGLVDNILQLSMMDTDGIRIEKRGVDFSVVFAEEAKKLGNYIVSPDVKYLVDAPMKSLFITVDTSRIFQILDAFVNNAAKFTEKGFVRVGYRYINGLLTVSCRDTGCGIPLDKQKVVFERFVKLNDFVQGTGLGLSVCKLLADEMGGNIDIYSREGEGTTITLSLDLSKK